MLIGYVRVSKSDGSQTLTPQRDAMLAAGVDPARIYEDLASGRRDDRPGLAACLKAIQSGNTLVLSKSEPSRSIPPSSRRSSPGVISARADRENSWTKCEPPGYLPECLNDRASDCMISGQSR